MTLNRTFVLFLGSLCGCGGDAIPAPNDLASVDAAAADAAGGTGTWYNTCGDSVCHGHSDHPGVPACTTQKVGTACSPIGAQCDPISDCNQLVVCATQNPVTGPGGCPVSRRRFKEDISYLDDADRARYHRELMTLPLATYHYRDARGPRRQLGFILEDAEPSAGVDSARDMVDLYGYTSMAVAALQVQARQIETLQREVDRLSRQLHKRR